MTEMPRINRIRISNITYDRKRILDQMFDTYDGENVLFNLANGSGKSVLVQLMLQAILPKVKIHNRNVESYLPTDRSAAYIMLEWKLDNTPQPTYFMTGIAMCLSGNEENNARLKYFTFTNDYKEANEFDIANIPLVEKEEQNVKYFSYDNAMKLLRQAEDINVRYFPADQSDEYKKILAQHGIYVDEWKIISRINDQEGGVDELFKKSSTSDKLIDDWILRTITESMNSSNDLQEMFIALMKSVMEQNENIKNKELLTQFQSSVKGYETKINELLASLSKSKDIETLLMELRHYCGRQIDDAEHKIQECNERNSEIQSDEYHIKYESISEDYYVACDKYKNLLVELEKKEQDFLFSQEKYNTSKLKKETYEAAVFFENIKNDEGELAIWRQRQENLSDEEQDNKLQKIGGTLLSKYTKLYNDLEIDISKNSEKSAANKELESEISNKITNITENEMEKRTSLGGLRVKCSDFKEEEKRVFSELGTYISRLLTGELDKTEVEAQKLIFFNNIKVKEDKFVDLKERRDAINNRSAEVDEAITINTKQVNEAQKELDEYSKEKNVYHEMKARLLDVLSKYEIGAEREFDTSFNKQDVNDRKNEISFHQQKLAAKIEKQKELIAALDKGLVHASCDLADVLEAANIEFETGEQYLNKEKDSRRKALLDKNPALPYCYLIPQKDMDKLRNIKLSEPMMRAIPILAFEDINLDLEPINTYVNWNNGLLACNYYEQCFDINMRQSFKDQLDSDLILMENEHKNREESIRIMNRDINIIEDYPYKSGYLESINAKVDGINQNLDLLNADLKKLTQEKNDLNNQARIIPDKIQQCQLDLNKFVQIQADFQSYLEKDKQYVIDRNKLDEVERELSELAKNKADLIKQKDHVANVIEEIASILRTAKGNIAQYKIKIDEYKSIVNTAPGLDTVDDLELSTRDIFVLEQQFNDLQRKRSNDKEEIDRNIKRINKTIEDWRKRLNKFDHIPQERYESITLSDEISDRLDQDEELTSKELDAARNEQASFVSKTEVAKSNIAAEEKRLKDIGQDEPLPKSEVKGNYAYRLKKLKEMSVSTSEIETVQIKRKSKYVNKQAAIARVVDTTEESVPLTHGDEEYEKLDIELLTNEFKEINKKNESQKTDIYEKYLSIKKEFEGKHSIFVGFMTVMDTNELPLEFEDYYFVFERLSESIKRLNDFIEVINTELRSVEEDTKHLNQHALEHGKRIHQEMLLITKTASVKLEGRRTSQQMLDIDIPEQLDNYCEDRMKGHIDYCIEAIRKDCEAGDNIEEIVRKKVRILLSDRKILNVVIDKESLKVKLYKADINVAASELRLWENVIVGNSGGQMFISCFAMISALIDYTRNKAIEGSGGDRLEVSKAFIIDNPFGKMSSNHLLEVLGKIADKFNCQMLCLSDLSQSSITSRFPVIYQLMLQKAKYSSQTYLQTVDTRIKSDVSRNEKLEHAFLRTKLEQLSLFN